MCEAIENVVAASSLLWRVLDGGFLVPSQRLLVFSKQRRRMKDLTYKAPIELI